MDISYLLFLQKIRESLNGVFDIFFLSATSIGESTFFILMVSLIYWCYKKELGLYMMINYSISIVVNFILKSIFCVRRPWIRDSRIHPVKKSVPGAAGYSFPSGHTANAVSLFGCMAVYFRRSKIIKIVCIAIILIVAFSRNYLGVHTPQDVLFSLVFGVILLYLVRRLLGWIEENPQKEIIVVIASVLVSIGLLVYDCTIDISNADNLNLITYFSQIAGFNATVFLAAFIEKRYINFKTEGSIAVQIIKYVIGILGTVSIKKYLGIILADQLGIILGTFFSCFILCIFILDIYPLLFTKVLNSIGRK